MNKNDSIIVSTRYIDKSFLSMIFILPDKDMLLYCFFQSHWSCCFWCSSSSCTNNRSSCCIGSNQIVMVATFIGNKFREIDDWIRTRNFGSILDQTKFIVINFLFLRTITFPRFCTSSRTSWIFLTLITIFSRPSWSADACIRNSTKSVFDFATFSIK